jgi:hypothetical protein
MTEKAAWLIYSDDISDGSEASGSLKTAGFFIIFSDFAEQTI